MFSRLICEFNALRAELLMLHLKCWISTDCTRLPQICNDSVCRHSG